MRPVGYYKHHNRNSGRIKLVGENTLIASINPGHGGGDIELPKSCTWSGKHNAWKQVDPRINARVLLCIDDDTGDVILLQEP